MEEGEVEGEYSVSPENKRKVKGNNANLNKVKAPKVQKHRKDDHQTAEIHQNSTSTARPPSRVCTYWMQGICEKGNMCTFSHAVTPNVTREEALKNRQVCRFALMAAMRKTGHGCLKGTACTFSHDPARIKEELKNMSASAVVEDVKSSPSSPIEEEISKRHIVKNPDDENIMKPGKAHIQIDENYYVV